MGRGVTPASLISERPDATPRIMHDAEPAKMPTDLCSQSELDAKPPACQDCIMRNMGIIPGGAACCNATSLADCPRAWT